MIFLLFFSSKKMIYSHHLWQIKIIYNRKGKRGQAAFLKHAIDFFSFKLIVIMDDFEA
jgi:hypothetical protein